MAQVRNLTNDALEVPHYGKVVEPGAVFDLPDGDVLDVDAAGVHQCADDHEHTSDARRWDIPGVWAVVGAPPAPKPAPVVEPAPAE